MRAIYAAFRGDAKLDFSGDFYSFSLLNPDVVTGADGASRPADLRRRRAGVDVPDGRRGRRRPAGPSAEHHRLPRRGRGPGGPPGRGGGRPRPGHRGPRLPGHDRGVRRRAGPRAPARRPPRPPGLLRVDARLRRRVRHLGVARRRRAAQRPAAAGRVRGDDGDHHRRDARRAGRDLAPGTSCRASCSTASATGPTTSSATRCSTTGTTTPTSLERWQDVNRRVGELAVR